MAAQAAEIKGLVFKIAELDRLIGRSANNSFLPSAESIKDRAQRRVAAKAARKEEITAKRGKQPGALGASLPKRDHPASAVEHEPTRCITCGAGLSGTPVEGIEVRQVFNTPVPPLGRTGN